MAVPKKKTARSKTKTQHSAYLIKTRKMLENSVKLVKCKSCGENRQSHKACSACGFYKGKEVTPKKKAQVTKIHA